MPKKSNVYSGRGLAKKIGVSESAIRRAFDRGELNRIKLGQYKGKYDITEKNNQIAIQNILSNRQAGDKRSSVQPVKKNTKKKEKIPESIVFSGGLSEEEILDTEIITKGTSAPSMNDDMSELRRRKEIEAIRGQQIKNEQMRGKLVARNEVSRIFNKLWSIDTSQLIPMATKLAPDLASICGTEDQEVITKVREKIDKEVWKILSHCKRTMSEYLAKIGAENLEDEQD